MVPPLRTTWKFLELFLFLLFFLLGGLRKERSGLGTVARGGADVAWFDMDALLAVEMKAPLAAALKEGAAGTPAGGALAALAQARALSSTENWQLLCCDAL